MAELAAPAQSPLATLRRRLDHLRLYEATQMLLPGAFGLLAQPDLPAIGVVAAFAIAYWCHVLAVYSYNDECDHTADLANPRKRAHADRSLERLRRQTALLTAFFAAGALCIPPAAAAALLAAHLVCVAYSNPRLRLKRRLLGSECAHLFAGAAYFAAGVLVAGGDPIRHAGGAVLFGLLYLSGGVFNEIMDCEADRAARQHHLVTVIGRRPALGLVIVVQQACVAMLVAQDARPALLVACIGAEIAYAHALHRLRAEGSGTDGLLAFRGRYRAIFAALLAVAAIDVFIAPPFVAELARA
jgi:4-hydroxybenzoate polyprenyltransferase